MTTGRDPARNGSSFSNAAKGSRLDAIKRLDIKMHSRDYPSKPPLCR